MGMDSFRHKRGQVVGQVGVFEKIEHQIRIEGFRQESQVGQADLRASRVEDSDYALLAVYHWQGAYAKVDGPPMHGSANSSVLRQAAFGDVQIGHDKIVVSEIGEQ